jgi:hypothetical protein
MKKTLNVKRILNNCQPTFAEVKKIVPRTCRAYDDPETRNAVVNWPMELTQETPRWPELQALAGNWVSCACGNQCSIIPRREDGDGYPLDRELKNLGMSFYYAVREREVKRSLEVLNQIETRSAQLIKEILDKKKLEEQPSSDKQQITKSLLNIEKLKDEIEFYERRIKRNTSKLKRIKN